MSSAAQEIAEYEQSVTEALKRFNKRTHYEATSDDTPLDAILRTEPARLDALDVKDLRARLEGYGVSLSVELEKEDCVRLLHAFAETERGVQCETNIRLLQYFAGDGPHPAKVLRRVFAAGCHQGVSPYCDLTVRERGIFMNESHGSQHWIMGRICTDPLRRKGAKAWKAAGQKSLASRGSFSQCQQGNDNRKKKK